MIKINAGKIKDGFYVHIDKELIEFRFNGCFWEYENFSNRATGVSGLLDFSGIIKRCADKYSIDFFNRTFKQYRNHVKGYYIAGFKQKWYEKNIGKILNKIIYPYYKQIIDKDERLRKLHQKIYSLTGSNYYNSVSIRDEFIDNVKEALKFKYDDFLRFKAAAFTVLPMRGSIFSTEWREFYTGGQKISRPLNITLNSINWVMPLRLYRYLKRHYYIVERSLTSKYEFIATLLSHDTFRGANNLNLDIIKNASKDQLREALLVYKIYGYRGRCKSIYNTDYIHDFIFYCNDYPNPYNGSVINLVKRSFEWHQELNDQRQREEEERRLKADKQRQEKLLKNTAIPPIPLPSQTDGISFLSTGQQIWDESFRMNHCVRNYIDNAINGEIYLFHIDYKDEMATAEIEKHGTIRQIKGPYNCDNKACEYGRNVLSKWGKKLNIEQTNKKIGVNLCV